MDIKAKSQIKLALLNKYKLKPQQIKLINGLLGFKVHPANPITEEELWLFQREIMTNGGFNAGITNIFNYMKPLITAGLVEKRVKKKKPTNKIGKIQYRLAPSFDVLEVLLDIKKRHKELKFSKKHNFASLVLNIPESKTKDYIKENVDLMILELKKQRIENQIIEAKERIAKLKSEEKARIEQKTISV